MGSGHLPGLNGLRFLAAYLVVVHHGEQARAKLGLWNLKAFSIANSGGFAVTFFFVLSGFLITLLLLRENAATGRTDIMRFYVRRALRIWPLYFLLVFIGLLLVPAAVALLRLPYGIPYEPLEVLPLYVFFLPFVVNARYGPHVLDPLWSIGVEEWFYLAWAPLFALFRRRLLVLFGLVIAARVTVLMVARHLAPDTAALEVVRMLLFEAMAVGAFGGWLVSRGRESVTGWLFSRPVQLAAYGLLVAQIAAGRWLSSALGGLSFLAGAGDAGIALRLALFLWVILDVSSNPRRLFAFEGAWLDRLGDVSYGIYMYHQLVGTTVAFATKRLLSHLDPVASTALFHALLATGTIAIALLSKRHFEDRFLALKDRFAAVPASAGACSPR